MNPHPTFEGLLRIHAEVVGYSQALAVAQQLLPPVQQHVLVSKLQIEPYWKIPEYYEIALFFEGQNLSSKFDALLDTLASGWNPVHRYSDLHWAIWNASETSPFVADSARWANLEVSLRGEVSSQAVEQS